MSSSTPPVTVATVTCAFTESRWDDLSNAIDSLKAQSRAPDEIIVVIDYNAPLLERARSELEDAVVIANSHMRGASGCRNTGCDEASSSVIAFLDDDAQADRSWLAQLLLPYEDSQVAGVGGKALPVWPVSRPAWFPPQFDWVVGCSYDGLPESLSPVRNLIGTNMSVRRELMLAVGGFREGFGNVVSGATTETMPARLSTGEETDLCIRISQADPSLLWLYEPRAVVQHRVPAARTRIGYFLSRCWIEGKGKAALHQLLGPTQALASERTYSRRTLPAALAGDLLRHPARDDWAGFRRGLAIVAGFATTALAYAAHRAGGATRG